jgi:hypothetical protein
LLDLALGGIERLLGAQRAVLEQAGRPS